MHTVEKIFTNTNEIYILAKITQNILFALRLHFHSVCYGSQMGKREVKRL